MRGPIFAPILKNLSKWEKTEKEQFCTIVAILTIRHLDTKSMLKSLWTTSPD